MTEGIDSWGEFVFLEGMTETKKLVGADEILEQGRVFIADQENSALRLFTPP